MRFKGCFRVCGRNFFHIYYIPFTQEENDRHQLSKPTDPSKAPNPHRFGPPAGTPHRHRRTEEEDPHLHIGDKKSKD
jgi:hypothetical protein